MKLTVDADLGLSFISYLIEQISIWLQNNVDEDRLKSLQEYVDTEPKYKSIFTSKINLYDLCLNSFLVLGATKYKYFYELEFDRNSIVYGTNIKTTELINLINYGNLVVKPYPIFSEMFGFFTKNLSIFEDSYLSSIGE